MTDTERPEIGATVDANGIKTNYLEAGEGAPVVLVHGSGPGVTAYANWRLVIPALAEDFHVIAPDLVGFGFSERPGDVEYSVQTWADQVVGLMDSARHRAGIGGGQQLRRRDRAARSPPSTRSGSTAHGPDGQHGRRLPDHRGPRTGLGLRAVVREHAQGARRVRLQPGVWSPTSWPRCATGRASQPGFQESFAAMFPAPRQRWVDAMRTPDDEIRQITHQTLIVARPRGQGDPGRDVADPDAADGERASCMSSRTAGTGCRSSGRPTSTASSAISSRTRPWLRFWYPASPSRWRRLRQCCARGTPR